MPKLLKPVSRPAQSVEFSGSLDASADRHWCAQPCALVMEGTRPGDTKSRYPQPALNHVVLRHCGSLHFFPRVGFTIFTCKRQEATVAFLEYILGGVLCA